MEESAWGLQHSACLTELTSGVSTGPIFTVHSSQHAAAATLLELQRCGLGASFPAAVRGATARICTHTKHSTCRSLCNKNNLVSVVIDRLIAGFIEKLPRSDSSGGSSRRLSVNYTQVCFRAIWWDRVGSNTEVQHV